MNFLKRLFGRSQEHPMPAAEAPSQRTTIHEPDPLDPHGDGTIREGDALYEMLMNGAGSVVANRNDDGTWDAVSRPLR